MRPAGNFTDRVIRPEIDLVVATVRIRVQITSKSCQKLCRTVAGAILREVVHRVWMLLADVRPEASIAAAFRTALEHRHGCVVCPQHGRLQDQLFLPLVERTQQFGRRLDPVAQRAAGNVQSVTRKKILLPVQRQVLTELSDDYLRNEPWPCNAAGYRSRRRRWARHAVLAVAARIFGPDVDVHLELGRHVVEDLGLVLTDAILSATTATAGLLRRR